MFLEILHFYYLKTTRGALLDVLLKNKPNSLQKSGACKTGLSDCHKIVFTIFRSTFIRLPQKFLNFNENTFCHELDQILLKRVIYKSENPYSKLAEIFQEILQNHAPVKSRNFTETCSCKIKKFYRSILL